MTLNFDDILQAICSKVTASHANDHQNVYVLETGLEAKLAYDILVSFGFDAKVYHTPDKPSKLYITTPKFSAAQVERNLTAALPYAQALKKIVLSLDELPTTGFNVNFVNAQPAGKQIMIQIGAPSDAQKPSGNVGLAASSAAAPESPPAAVAAVSAPISSTHKRVVRKTKKKDDDEFASGPAVGRGLYPAKVLPEGGTAKQSMRQKIMLRMFGNFATSGYFTLMWLVAMAVLFSFFVFAKSFLCYDFVSKKSTKWYCQDPAQSNAEDAQRKEREDRQKALGLAPVQK